MSAQLVNCEICNKELKKQSYKQHFDSHKNEKSKCKHCGKDFVQSSSLKRHMVQIHKVLEGYIGNYDKVYGKYTKVYGKSKCI